MPRLERKLGFKEALILSLSAMLGAGVYVSLGEAAATTGGSLLLAVLLGGGVALMSGLSAAELGAHDPRAGGAYQFGRQLVHPTVGFLAGWLFLLAGLAASATYTLTFGAYLQPLLPWVPLQVLGLALVAAATALNAVGVRLSIRASVVLVAANLLILVAFVLLTLPTGGADPLDPFLSSGLAGLLQASALLFFAYTGFARPVTVAEEVRQPETVLPRAVPTAIGIIAVLYLGVALAGLAALGPGRFGVEPAPLRAAALAAGAPLGPQLVSLGALLATSGVLLAEVWGLSRLAFAMARNQDLPAWLGRLSPPNNIPRRGVLVIGGIVAVLTITVDLRSLLEASSFALLFYYAVMNLSALRLPRRWRRYPRLVPLAGLGANTALAASLPPATLLTVLVVAAVGLAYYGWRRRGVP